MSFRDTLVLFLEPEFSYVIADDVLVVIDGGFGAVVSVHQNRVFQVFNVPDVRLCVTNNITKMNYGISFYETGFLNLLFWSVCLVCFVVKKQNLSAVSSPTL